MANEVAVFRDELVPVLEDIDGYTVVDLIDASREIRMLVSRRIDQAMEGQEFARMWIPFDMASSGVNLDLVFPTHLLVPDDAATEGKSPEELYSCAEAAIDIVTKHVEVKNDELEEELRSFGEVWERRTVMQELDLFIKEPIDVSETTFTVCRGIELHDGDGEVTGDGLAELKEIVQESDEHVSDQLFSLNRPKEVLNLVLAVIGAKDGTDIYGRLPDMHTVERFVEVLNELGLNCGVKVTEFDHYPPFVRVFATRDDAYSIDEYRTFFAHRDAEVHRMTGAFYGYPEEEIEAWINWRRSDDPDETVGVAATLAGEYGYDEQTQERLMALINYMVRDREEAIDQAVQVANQRYQALKDVKEDYGVDFLEYLEEF